MTETEHLLIILIEECSEIIKECSEVQQRASKTLRFGLDEIQTGQPFSNLERLRVEVNDLLAVLELLENRVSIKFRNSALIAAKKDKVEKYLEHSRQCGTLNMKEYEHILNQDVEQYGISDTEVRKYTDYNNLKEQSNREKAINKWIDRASHCDTMAEKMSTSDGKEYYKREANLIRSILKDLK